jgi:hypothetical protein
MSMSQFLNVAAFEAAKQEEALQEALVASRIKAAFEAAKQEEARQEALVASRIKAAAVVTHLQQTGDHWTLSAKPEKTNES